VLPGAGIPYIDERSLMVVVPGYSCAFLSSASVLVLQVCARLRSLLSLNVSCECED
jgi:hypothetical protein